MNRMNHVACSALALALTTLGCSGDDDAGDPPDPARLACDETDEEGDPIGASAASDATTPAIEIGAEPYTVTLSADAPTYLRVEVDEDTPAVLLLGAEDVVSALYRGQLAEELVSAGEDEFCPDEIPEHFDVDFHEPGTYFIEFSPSALERVWLLLSGAAGHAHEH